MSAALHEAVRPCVLSGDLWVSVDAHPRTAAHVEWAIRDEVRRLCAIFDPRDPASEFSQWRLGGTELPSPDLTYVLTMSERLWVFSQGAFHPGVEPLRRRWRDAEAAGITPSKLEMRELASSLELPYTTMHGPVQRLGDCSAVELTALVDGYVLDSALSAGWACGLASSIVLRSGLHIRHRGTGSVRVDLGELLGTPAPVGVVEVRDGALSGVQAHAVDSAAEILDPHTGWPNERIHAVATLAADSVSAAVGAAVLSVRAEGARAPQCAWLAVAADGISRSHDWPIAPPVTD